MTAALLLLVLGATVASPSTEADTFDAAPAAAADPAAEATDAMTLRPQSRSSLSAHGGAYPALTTSCCGVCLDASCVGCSLLDYRFTRGACGQAGAAWWATATGGAGVGLVVGALVAFFPGVIVLAYGLSDSQVSSADAAYGMLGVIGAGACTGALLGGCGGAVLGSLAALITFGDTLAFGPRRRRPPPPRRRMMVQEGEVGAPEQLASAQLAY